MNDLEQNHRWSDIDKLLSRTGPSATQDFTQDTLGNPKTRQFQLEKVRVLVIGAGGLGCELLKNLSLVGFTRIDVIDMDIINYSNLNRQFLFRPCDVMKPKAEVAAAFVNNRVHGAKVKAHFCRIEEKPDSFYQKFNIIVAGLDSIVARRWINETLCTLATKVKDESGNELDEWNMSTVIPLVDGGTEGFMGQARVILPNLTPCFECLLHLFPPDPLNFQECTLVATPRQPQHCISWAMRFAWEDDPEKKNIKINGDDPDHIKWLYEKALQRAQDCKIEGVTLKLTQGVVKRIIPAIASTNAVIAATCANETFKIATSSSHHLKNWMMYNGTDGVYTSTTKYDKNEDCLVCSRTGTTIHCDPYQTLKLFIDMLIADKDKFLAITDPSISRITATGEKSFLHMTGILRRQTAANLQKSMWDLCQEGDTLLITNRRSGKPDENGRARDLDDGTAPCHQSNRLSKIKMIRLNIHPMASTCFPVRIDLLQPIAMLKLYLEDHHGIAIEEQHLIYAGKPLEDLKLFSDYDIDVGDTIFLVHNKGVEIDEAKWGPYRKLYATGKVTPTQQLAQYGYKFNHQLELRSISTGAKYHWVDQASYDLVGDAICDFIEEFLITEFGFLRNRIPVDADPDDRTTSILVSRGALDAEQLLVLVPTSGNARAGMWVRRVCVNDSLYTGSMIRYIKEALILGFKIILLNPNISVQNSQNPADHMLYVYDNFISKSVSTSVAFILHQVAGDCLTYVLRLRPELIPKVGAMAFLDPTYSVNEAPGPVKACLQTRGRVWLSSPAALNTPQPEFQNKFGCPVVSSGHSKFVISPSIAQEAILEWLKQQYKSKIPEASVVAANRTKWQNRERSWVQKFQ